MHVLPKQIGGPRVVVLLCFFLTTSIWWNQRLHLQGLSSALRRRPSSEAIIMNGNIIHNNGTTMTVTTMKFTDAALLLTAAGVALGDNNYTSEEQASVATSHEPPNQMANSSPMKCNNNHDIPYASSSRNDEAIPFHRWNSAQGIDIVALWHYVQIRLVANESDKRDRYGPVPAYIFAETANILISNKVYRRRCENNHGRYLYVGPFLQESLHDYYKNSSSSSSSSTNHNETQFPFLTRALKEGGLPLILNLEDYVGCNHHNYYYPGYGEINATTTTTLANIPMLTLSSSPSCDFAFPIPSYTTLKLAKQAPDDWSPVFHKNDLEYPWNTKLQKAVWRGVPSDGWKMKTSVLDIPRVYLNYLAKNHSDALDVAMGCVPPCRVSKRYLPWVTVGGFIPMADFQKYRAVLDIDGGSWSERFPRLLCQNSVVIKLDPDQIDYFWPTLKAGVHFLAANLSNVVDVARYAIADDNQEEMQRIVSNAHEWCRQRMVIRQIRLDILSVFEGYSQELYKGDANWRRHISKLFKLKLVYPPQWSENPVSRWNTT